jgi:hypothetical protein
MQIMMFSPYLVLKKVVLVIGLRGIPGARARATNTIALVELLFSPTKVYDRADLCFLRST